jgi:large subunit ribosomal protein L19
MSANLIQSVDAKFKKSAVLDVQTGDTVKVYQRIKEGDKERLQMFQGTVIKTARQGSLTSTIWVRKVSSGVGVERSFLLHSPLVEKVEITARGKVRRNFLSYLRERSGKSARLANQAFDREAVNTLDEVEQVLEAEAETPEMKEEERLNPNGAAAEPAE